MNWLLKLANPKSSNHFGHAQGRVITDQGEIKILFSALFRVMHKLDEIYPYPLPSLQTKAKNFRFSYAPGLIYRYITDGTD